MTTENQDHDAHDPITHPVPGCIICDKVVKRPIKLCFGLGASEQVIPASRPENVEP